MKIRRVNQVRDQGGAIYFPADMYRTIFEKLVRGGEVELGHRQCFDLHAVSVVCQSFYKLVNEIIGQMLRSVDPSS